MNSIKIARTNAGLSQKEIAITLGVSVPTVSDWESGKKFPSGKNLVKLAQLLKVSTDYLLGLEEKGVLTMPDMPRTFFNKNGWPKDITEDYENAESDEIRIKILVNCGYDEAHIYAAHRYFPWQFNEEKRNLDMSEKSELAFLGDKWPDSYTEVYNGLKTDKKRRLFFLNNGYDKAHEPEARRLCPECFPADRSASPAGYDLLAPEDKELVDSMIRRLILEKNQEDISSPSREGTTGTAKNNPA